MRNEVLFPMNNAADQMNAKSAETQPAKERDSKISRLLGAYAPFWFAIASLLIYYVSVSEFFAISPFSIGSKP